MIAKNRPLRSIISGKFLMGHSLVGAGENMEKIYTKIAKGIENKDNDECEIETSSEL